MLPYIIGPAKRCIINVVSCFNAYPVLVLSQGGGTGIEEPAAKDPKAVVKVPFKYTEVVTAETVSLICDPFVLQADREELTNRLHRLFTFFKERDATVGEISHLICESENGFALIPKSLLTMPHQNARVRYSVCVVP